MKRDLVIQCSWRQLIGASTAILVALAAIAVLTVNPLGLASPFLRGLLIVPCLYACSVLSFDALWSQVFDWLPFAQDNAVYRVLHDREVEIKAQTGEPTA